MIWTKLTQTDVVFSRAASVVLLCAGFWIFRYAGKIPKNQKKISVPEGSRRPKEGHRATRGHPGTCVSWLPPGRAIEASRWVPNPLVPYLDPIYSLGKETPEQKSFFRST